MSMGRDPFILSLALEFLDKFPILSELSKLTKERKIGPTRLCNDMLLEGIPNSASSVIKSSGGSLENDDFPSAEFKNIFWKWHIMTRGALHSVNANYIRCSYKKMKDTYTIEAELPQPNRLATYVSLNEDFKGKDLSQSDSATAFQRIVSIYLQEKTLSDTLTVNQRYSYDQLVNNGMNDFSGASLDDLVLRINDIYSEDSESRIDRPLNLVTWYSEPDRSFFLPCKADLLTDYSSINKYLILRILGSSSVDSFAKVDIGRFVEGLFNSFSKLIESEGEHIEASVSTGSGHPEFTIYHGPPGTGKTWRVLKYVAEKQYDIDVVQLHPSYSYEDFIEGIKPLTFPHGSLKYDIVEGHLKVMARRASGKPLSVLSNLKCKDNRIVISLPIGTTKRYGLATFQIAENQEGLTLSRDYKCDNDQIELDAAEFKTICPKLSKRYEESIDSTSSTTWNIYHKLYIKGANWGTRQYALVLDEINRANITHVFGELLYSISNLDSDTNRPVRLQYSNEEFEWPLNLSLFGTMNTADTSSERIDQAIKRRFKFIECAPDPFLFSKPLHGSEEKSLGEVAQEALGNESWRGSDPITNYPSFKAGAIRAGIPQEHLKDLDTIFVEIFGSNKKLSEIMLHLNSTLIKVRDDYNLININQKLIGHAYFLEVIKGIVGHSLFRGISPEPKKRTGLMVAVLQEVVEKEIYPALVNIFNHDEYSLSQFLNKTYETSFDPVEPEWKQLTLKLVDLKENDIESEEWQKKSKKAS